MMHTVYLSLGSNINRVENITRCIAEFNKKFSKICCSPVYESEPVGFKGSNFYNLVVKITTELDLSVLASYLRELEEKHGRESNAKKFSPRHLDIDILLYDHLSGEVEGIELPRPELYFNAFVLLPMADLAGDVTDLLTGKTYQQLWKDKKQQILEDQTLWQVSVDLPN